jgi:hypothetical protein
MKNIRILFIVILLGFFSSCDDYLNVVPDNVATIDNAFTDKTQAEKYLFTCYSYLPLIDHPEANPAFFGGDEFWIFWPIAAGYYNSLASYNIARGLQNRANPHMNYWDGGGLARPLWQGIRSCNIFLENIDKVNDLDDYLKSRWVAEVKFLKAFYHWYLLKAYGPIPIIDENLPISASSEQVKVERRPVDEVVDYIVELIDDATGDDSSIGLPVRIDNQTTELGRITRPVALSVKAKILVTAASPLFNGNTDYSNFNNKDGTPLFNTTYSEEKWEKAVLACEEAIAACEQADIKLYEFNPNIQNVTDDIQLEMSIRNAVCEEWNSELIWGFTGASGYGGGNPSRLLQQYAIPNLDPNIISLSARAHLAPTYKMAELFYTRNGVPIDEDTTWDYENRLNLRTTSVADSSYLIDNYQTVGLHFDREPRFYADIAFDGSMWFMANNTWEFKSKSGQNAGKKQAVLYSITGYYAKKLVNWNAVFTTGGGLSIQSYAWPVMRLADLYLLYAEALNETGNMAIALEYLNKVRERAGLETVEDSWSAYSIYPSKYSEKNGLREIIQQERLIELAFEGHRFWDLRRWKRAASELNSPVYGWDVVQEDFANYNRRVLLFNQQFNAPRDYFWPLADNALIVNPNLVQNPGW